MYLFTKNFQEPLKFSKNVSPFDGYCIRYLNKLHKFTFVEEYLKRRKKYVYLYFIYIYFFFFLKSGFILFMFLFFLFIIFVIPEILKKEIIHWYSKDEFLFYFIEQEYSLSSLFDQYDDIGEIKFYSFQRRNKVKFYIFLCFIFFFFLNFKIGFILYFFFLIYIDFLYCYLKFKKPMYDYLHEFYKRCELYKEQKLCYFEYPHDQIIDIASTVIKFPDEEIKRVQLTYTPEPILNRAMWAIELYNFGKDFLKKRPLKEDDFYIKIRNRKRILKPIYLRFLKREYYNIYKYYNFKIFEDKKLNYNNLIFNKLIYYKRPFVIRKNNPCNIFIYPENFLKKFRESLYKKELEFEDSLDVFKIKFDSFKSFFSRLYKIVNLYKNSNDKLPSLIKNKFLGYTKKDLIKMRWLIRFKKKKRIIILKIPRYIKKLRKKLKKKYLIFYNNIFVFDYFLFSVKVSFLLYFLIKYYMLYKIKYQNKCENFYNNLDFLKKIYLKSKILAIFLFFDYVNIFFKNVFKYIYKKKIKYLVYKFYFLGRIFFKEIIPFFILIYKYRKTKRIIKKWEILNKKSILKKKKRYEFFKQELKELKEFEENTIIRAKKVQKLKKKKKYDRNEKIVTKEILFFVNWYRILLKKLNLTEKFQEKRAHVWVNFREPRKRYKFFIVYIFEIVIYLMGIYYSLRDIIRYVDLNLKFIYIFIMFKRKIKNFFFKENNTFLNDSVNKNLENFKKRKKRWNSLIIERNKNYALMSDIEQYANRDMIEKIKVKKIRERCYFAPMTLNELEFWTRDEVIYSRDFILNVFLNELEPYFVKIFQDIDNLNLLLSFFEDFFKKIFLYINFDKPYDSSTYSFNNYVSLYGGKDFFFYDKKGNLIDYSFLFYLYFNYYNNYDFNYGHFFVYKEKQKILFKNIFINYVNNFLELLEKTNNFSQEIKIDEISIQNFCEKLIDSVENEKDKIFVKKYMKKFILEFNQKNIQEFYCNFFISLELEYIIYFNIIKVYNITTFKGKDIYKYKHFFNKKAKRIVALTNYPYHYYDKEIKFRKSRKNLDGIYPGLEIKEQKVHDFSRSNSKPYFYMFYGYPDVEDHIYFRDISDLGFGLIGRYDDSDIFYY